MFSRLAAAATTGVVEGALNVPIEASRNSHSTMTMLATIVAECLVQAVAVPTLHRAVMAPVTNHFLRLLLSHTDDTTKENKEPPPF